MIDQKIFEIASSFVERKNDGFCSQISVINSCILFAASLNNPTCTHQIIRFYFLKIYIKQTIMTRLFGVADVTDCNFNIVLCKQITVHEKLVIDS